MLPWKGALGVEHTVYGRLRVRGGWGMGVGVGVCQHTKLLRTMQRLKASKSRRAFARMQPGDCVCGLAWARAAHLLASSAPSMMTWPPARSSFL